MIHHRDVRTTSPVPGIYPRAYERYVLLEHLSSGGMSEVDLAVSAVDEAAFVRFCVIKRVKPAFAVNETYVRMFMDEARITSALHHQNIGAVYDFGKVADEVYLALEFVPGVDLRVVTSALSLRSQRVPVLVGLRILADVLEALEHAHTRKDALGRSMGIVHRDVNPRNVLLSIHGEVKLIDFGVAKAADRLEDTREDQVKGKFGYLAPEQIGGQPIDHRTDLYVAGLVFNELLSGRHPCRSLNPVQLLHRVNCGWVPELLSIPGSDGVRLRRINDLALSPRPEDRFQSAAEFAAEVREAAHAMGGLPTNEQLAGFLTVVLPDLAPRMQQKLENYTRLGLRDRSGGVPEDDTALQDPVWDQTMDQTPSRSSGLAFGALLVLALAGWLLGAGLIDGALVALYLLSDGPRVETAPAPVLAPLSLPSPASPPRDG